MWNLIPVLGSIIDKLIPDPKLAAEAKLKAIELAQNGELSKLDAELRLSLGKPYDYTGILGLGINRDWQENDMWFCSEDVADTLKRSGLQLTGLLNVHSVFPQTCFDWKHKVLDRSVF